MSWSYSQSSGRLSYQGRHIATGYSGCKQGRNNPELQHRAFLGPIPQGRYRIAAPRDSAQTGPFVLELSPVDHDALGRDDFQIHGDNISHDASTGCIILSEQARRQMAASNDSLLIVVA